MYAPATILAMVPQPLTAPMYLGLREKERENRKGRGRIERNIRTPISGNALVASFLVSSFLVNSSQLLFDLPQVQAKNHSYS